VKVLFFGPAYVWVDNGSDDEISVACDDLPVALVQRHSMVRVEISSGSHWLRARNSGQVVDQVQLSGGRRGWLEPETWVFNVSQRNDYAVGFPGQTPRPIEPRPHVFPVPAGASTVLGVAGGGEPALVHWPRHPTWPCCASR
jgi:hypothetical protein